MEGDRDVEWMVTEIWDRGGRRCRMEDDGDIGWRVTEVQIGDLIKYGFKLDWGCRMLGNGVVGWRVKEI
jgi:hypothetical protein